MKINEVIAKSNEVLFEELDQINDTGFLTEDLVDIVRATDGPWKKMPDDSAEFDAYIALIIQAK